MEPDTRYYNIRCDDSFPRSLFWSLNDSNGYPMFDRIGVNYSIYIL